jgi:hypothetical protein
MGKLGVALYRGGGRGATGGSVNGGDRFLHAMAIMARLKTQ